MSLGQAAGVAADVSLRQQTALPQIDVSLIQSQLHRLGAATTYISDVPPQSDDFQMTQRWGLLGGWHAIAPKQEGSSCGQRGPHLTGQYYEAFPGHNAGPDAILSDYEMNEWLKVAKRNGIEVTKQAMPLTRRKFLQRVWAHP